MFQKDLDDIYNGLKKVLAIQKDIRASLIRQAEIPFNNLKARYSKASIEFIAKHQDADIIDFIKEELSINNELIKEIKRLDLKVKLFSRDKYIQFLEHELKIEQEQISKLGKLNLLSSNSKRIEVIYALFTLKELGVFRFENDSVLAKFIERYCTYGDGKKITKARQAISNIRNGNINTEPYKIKFQEFYKALDL